MIWCEGLGRYTMLPNICPHYQICHASYMYVPKDAKDSNNNTNNEPQSIPVGERWICTELACKLLENGQFLEPLESVTLTGVLRGWDYISVSSVGLLAYVGGCKEGTTSLWTCLLGDAAQPVPKMAIEMLLSHSRCYLVIFMSNYYQ